MFSLIYIIVIDICAFFFIGYGIYGLNSKKPIPFLFVQSKSELKVSNIKQFNRGVSIFHIFFGLCLLIVGIIATYFNLRVASIVLLLVLLVCIPTLSYAYSFLINRYKV